MQIESITMWSWSLGELSFRASIKRFQKWVRLPCTTGYDQKVIYYTLLFFFQVMQYLIELLDEEIHSLQYSLTVLAVTRCKVKCLHIFNNSNLPHYCTLNSVIGLQLQLYSFLHYKFAYWIIHTVMLFQ